jgi:hypothetical protein
VKNAVDRRSEKEIVRALASDVDRSPLFHSQRAPRLTEALNGFVDAYGAPPSTDLLERFHGLAHRLKVQLEHCFEEDRSFWLSPDQYALQLPSATQGLVLGRLSNVVKDGPHRFWFHQLARHDVKRTVCVFSEPLFFFSQSLNAYVRFLDLNHDAPSFAKAPELAEAAKDKLRERLQAQGLEANSAIDLARALDFSPVRLYVPAGDAFGISWIRRWYRGHKDLIPPIRRERRRVPADADSELNRIVFASRYTNPSLVYFREVCPNLRCDLTERGIRVDNEEIPDDVGRQGTTLAHVVVTNWVFETNKVYTVIASNHTRAAGRVAQLLVAGDKEQGPHLDPARLVLEGGLIPKRIQFAFSVELNLNEVFANAPDLFAGPFVYD